MQKKSKCFKLLHTPSLFIFFSPIFFVFIGTTLLLGLCDLEAYDLSKGEKKLEKLYSKLNLNHGDFKEEYPEQRMVATFLSKDAVVLELGGNIGRNSCIIGSILRNPRNFVVVESSESIARLLKENRDLNRLSFYIEASAISKVPLIQNGWDTIPSDVDVPGWSRIKTITFNELQEKYCLTFDTLVVDCEGALYYILRDDPKILKNIKLVIIENDFQTSEQMIEVQNLFIKNGLQCVYNEPYTIDYRPCGDSFFQVWTK